MERLYSTYKIEHWCYTHHLKFFAAIIRVLMRLCFSSDIHPGVIIGKNCSFPHDGLGLLIANPTIRIGDNCTILHGVTFGGRGSHKGRPIIGNNVLIGCHAIVLGPVHIGDNAVIGAGSVVIHDVPENTIVAGNPAKIIGTNE